MGKFSPKKFKKKEEENAVRRQKSQEKMKASFVRKLPTVSGKNLYRFKETNTGGDYPWEEMAIHYNCGPDGETQIRCIRDVIDEGAPGYLSSSKCPVCAAIEKDKKAGKKGDARAKIRASKRRRVPRMFLEGICLTPLIKFFDGDVSKIPQPKACFGTYAWKEDDSRYNECQSCVKKTSWGKVCQNGVGILGIGPTVGDPLVSMASKIYKSMNHNPFDLKEGHNYEFTRAGEGLQTKYSDVGFSLEPYDLPKVVKAFMKENSVDWTTVYPKLSYEETENQMKGVEFEDDEDEKDESFG